MTFQQEYPYKWILMKLVGNYTMLLIPCLFCFLAIGWVLPSHGLEAISIPRALPPCPAKHIRSILVDQKGAIWVAPENDHLYCLEPDQSYAGPWRSLKYSPGIPDTLNFTCLAEDQQGRIWVGTDNQGVAVFNGESWQVHDWKNTLPGNHVTAFAISPKTGEIAMATSDGLAIYHPATDQWLTRTRSHGLVENQIASLAFDATGNLWIAYFCGGISWGHRASSYSQWKTIQAPWIWSEIPYARQPLESSGKGLPSNLCNSVLSGMNGSILVGTCSGLSYKKKNRSWEFLRGRDYLDKNKGLFSAAKLPKKILEKKSSQEGLLPEDFITTLHETQQGYWCGFRRQGAALLDRETLRVRAHQVPDGNKLSNPWVTSIASLPDGTVLCGTYGNGISILERGSGEWTRKNKSTKTSSIPFPSVLPANSQEDILTSIDEIKKNIASAKTNKSPVVFWKDDWMTQGNWCGRYGQEMAALCAANAPLESAILYQSSDISASYMLTSAREMKLVKEQSVHIWGLMGPHRKNDGLRHWVHHFNDQYNPNVLYCPTDATRTEAEWDDHGEAYPYTFDGPDVCALVQVLEPNHHIDLYFFNPNGRKLPEGFRDYLIEVKKVTTDQNPVFLERAFSLPDMQKEWTRMANEKILLRTRVNFFSGTGVYKRFLVHEPGYYLFRVVKNYSFNTILNGLFVSRLGQISKQKFNPLTLDSDFAGLCPHTPDVDIQGLSPQQKDLLSIANMITPDPKLIDRRDALLRQFLRMHLETPNKTPFTEQLRWAINDFTGDDFQHFHEVMETSWAQKQDTQPAYRSAEFMPHAPNVIPFSVEEVNKMHAMQIDWKQYLPGSSPTKSVEEMKAFLKTTSIPQPSNNLTKKHQEAVENAIKKIQEAMAKEQKGK